MNRILLRFTSFALVLPLITSCAFKRIIFDNKTTSESFELAGGLYEVERANNGRNVKVTANFQSLDSIDQLLLDRGNISSRGRLEIIKAGISIIEEQTSQTQIRANYGYLQNLDRRYKAMITAGLIQGSEEGAGLPISMLIDLPRDAADEDRISTAPTDLDAVYRKQLDIEQKKILQDFPDYGKVMGDLYSKVQGTTDYTNFKTTLASPKNLPRRATLITSQTENLVNTTVKTVQEFQEALKAQNAALGKKYQELKAEIEKSDAKLQELFSFLASKNLSVEDVGELLTRLEQRDLAPQAAAAAAEAPQIAALKNERDELKRKKDKAEESLAALNALDLPGLPKYLAQSAQQKVVDDLQGEYEETNQEYLAALSQVNAVTNYEGPGERAVIYSLNLLEPPDKVQRFPNGMIASVGCQPQARGLGRSIFDGLWRTIRVISTPAAVVASVFLLR